MFKFHTACNMDREFENFFAIYQCEEGLEWISRNIVAATSVTQTMSSVV